MSMLIFEGRGCQRTWYTNSISALLDMGEKTEPYLSPEPTIDIPGGSSNGNYDIMLLVCILLGKYVDYTHFDGAWDTGQYQLS